MIKNFFKKLFEILITPFVAIVHFAIEKSFSKAEISQMMSENLINEAKAKMQEKQEQRGENKDNEKDPINSEKENNPQEKDNKVFEMSELQRNTLNLNVSKFIDEMDDNNVPLVFGNQNMSISKGNDEALDIITIESEAGTIFEGCISDLIMNDDMMNALASEYPIFTMGEMSYSEIAETINEMNNVQVMEVTNNTELINKAILECGITGKDVSLEIGGAKFEFEHSRIDLKLEDNSIKPIDDVNIYVVMDGVKSDLYTHEKVSTEVDDGNGVDIVTENLNTKGSIEDVYKLADALDEMNNKEDLVDEKSLDDVLDTAKEDANIQNDNIEEKDKSNDLEEIVA